MLFFFGFLVPLGLFLGLVFVGEFKIKRHQCHHKVGGARKWYRNSVEFEEGVEEDKEARAVDVSVVVVVGSVQCLLMLSPWLFAVAFACSLFWDFSLLKKIFPFF